MALRNRICVIAAAFAAISLAGCAGGPGSGPDGIGLASGAGCKSLKREIRKYEVRGIQYKADAANRGAKLSSKQRADVRRDNSLLDSYLGGKCHV